MVRDMPSQKTLFRRDKIHLRYRLDGTSSSECQQTNHATLPRKLLRLLRLYKREHSLNKSVLRRHTLRDWWMFDVILLYYRTLQPTLQPTQYQLTA